MRITPPATYPTVPEAGSQNLPGTALMAPPSGQLELRFPQWVEGAQMEKGRSLEGTEDITGRHLVVVVHVYSFLS